MGIRDSKYFVKLHKKIVSIIYFPYCIALLGAIIFLVIALVITIRYYDFGINLIAEAIGVLVTLILIEFILVKLKKNQWNKVKEVVMEKIRVTLNGIFIEINNLSADGGLFEVVKSEDEKSGESTFESKKIENLKKMHETKEFRIARSFKRHLKEGKFGLLFKHRAEELGEIEKKYSEFLPANLIRSIIIIEEALERIHTTIEIKKKKTLLSYSDKTFYKNLSYYFKKIVDQLYEIKESGLNFTEKIEGSYWDE